ncbi:hypothetical protein [Thiothrix nivea]|uniref:Lipoprotein n=1 Tax=Thiothrix nivea (strain ATCC 35100 / DSM 5205 / JP2) TaxID=870187 RepID=A0A656HFP1_THINJ|nr:hypothetical protein [Thiothrix nivea]EIJ34814.1 hypothetical protein Thini_2255 [Thiothrix nivea DSM 5205]
MLRAIFLLFLTSFLGACVETGPVNPSPQTMTGTPLQVANTVVQAIDGLQNGGGGLQPFTSLFDPAGVRFMPYYRMEPSDVTLTADGFESDFIPQNPPPRVWGTQDGSGDPISLSTRNYFSKYVADFPYHNNATVTLINSNGDFQSQGNLINNLLASFPMPQYRIVEYHQPGTDPAFGGLDWTSLMVILKDVGGGNQWTLVGLAHGSWTI